MRIAIGNLSNETWQQNLQNLCIELTNTNFNKKLWQQRIAINKKTLTRNAYYLEKANRKVKKNPNDIIKFSNCNLL